jgi:Family of unknown function (DUF7002)
MCRPSVGSSGDCLTSRWRSLIDRYRAGASINDLAGYFKIHRTTASLHLLRQGVRGRRRTEALLDRFEVAEPQRTELLTRRRAVSVTISHPEHGTAVVRDNIPLSESKLAAALTDMTVEQWLRLLNSKVFFWLQRERVNRLLGARAYRDSSHLSSPSTHS